MDYFKFDREKALRRLNKAQGYEKHLALAAITRFDAWEAERNKTTVPHSLAQLIEARVPVARIRRVFRNPASQEAK